MFIVTKNSAAKWKIFYSLIFKSNVKLYIFTGWYLCFFYFTNTDKKELFCWKKKMLRISHARGKTVGKRLKNTCKISGSLIVLSSFHPSSSFHGGVCSAAKWHPPSLLMNPLRFLCSLLFVCCDSALSFAVICVRDICDHVTALNARVLAFSKTFSINYQR